MKSSKAAYFCRVFARVCIIIVFAWNVLCAFQFIIFPQSYVDTYQLSGAGAKAAIEGLGVAFLMWNATYPIIIWKPNIYRVVFRIVIAQQIIGIIGESLVLFSLGTNVGVLFASIMRFLQFDVAGLIFLCLGYVLTSSALLKETLRK